MKKLLLLSIAIVAMVGTSNAQQTSYCDGTPVPQVCGYYVSDGAFVFTKCIAVNCQIDSNNCGRVGNVCGSSCPTCDNGVCTSDDGSGIGFGGEQNAKRTPKPQTIKLPTRLKPLEPIKL